MTRGRTDFRALKARRDSALARPELAEDKSFVKTVATTLRDGLKLKAVMLKRGLKAARARCPECDGELNGRLVGPRDHLRFWCSGPCKRQMME